MIEFLSSWTKNLCLALIVVSILEMLIPNNKTKKYIKMIMGLYILFSIISPFIQNSDKFNINNFNLNEYVESIQETGGEITDQTSIDERLSEIYVEELENDITQKLEEKGFIINKCKVSADILNNDENSGIKKIVLNIQKQTEENQSIEEKIVSEIQKIQEVNINSKNENSETVSNLSKTDIEDVKNFLIDEYGVSENCLEIN